MVAIAGLFAIVATSSVEPDRVSAPKDARLVDCSPDAITGVLVATIEVTNPGPEAADYFVTVESETELVGNRGTEELQELAVGESRTVRIQVAPRGQEDVGCVLAAVVRVED